MYTLMLTWFDRNQYRYEWITNIKDPSELEEEIKKDKARCSDGTLSLREQLDTRYELWQIEVIDFELETPVSETNGSEVP